MSQSKQITVLAGCKKHVSFQNLLGGARRGKVTSTRSHSSKSRSRPQAYSCLFKVPETILGCSLDSRPFLKASVGLPGTQISGPSAVSKKVKACWLAPQKVHIPLKLRLAYSNRNVGGP